MKLVETERTISAYADGLRLAGVAGAAESLQSVAEFLREFQDRTMADLVDCDGRVEQYRTASPASLDEPTVFDIILHLEALKSVLKAARSPTARTNDLGLLIDLLRSGHERKGDSRYLSPMLNALRQALAPQQPEAEIREFIDRLKAEAGSDRFCQVLSELENSSLKKEHVVEIARAIYGGIPRKTSRKAALAYIRKPHDAYMSAKRGIDATGGRSAA